MMKILIVEDDELSLNLLKIYLKKMKISDENIFSTDFGDDAIEFCKNNDDISFVLMDINLGIGRGKEGKDGKEVTKEILKNKFVPIIMVTAQSSINDRFKSLECGCLEHISKPMSFKILHDVLFNLKLIKE